MRRGPAAEGEPMQSYTS